MTLLHNTIHFLGGFGEESRHVEIIERFPSGNVDGKPDLVIRDEKAKTVAYRVEHHPSGVKLRAVSYSTNVAFGRFAAEWNAFPAYKDALAYVIEHGADILP